MEPTRAKSATPAARLTAPSACLNSESDQKNWKRTLPPVRSVIFLAQDCSISGTKPVGGKVSFFKYQPGKFLNALKTECASENENVLLGFAPAERPGEKMAIRLVAGLIARRIEPWVAAGDEVARGERISLIQFGSRVEVYLPLSAHLECQLGDKVVGGETVLAKFT